MNPHLWWHVARATGIVAWALLSAAVIWGLLVSTRLSRGRPTPAWLLDLHRFLGGAAVGFTALHLAGLVADHYVQFGAADLLVPYAAAWKPGAVAVGVVSLYLLVVVEATSLVMRRIPRRVWRAVHMTSYVLFWSATFHFLLAGTDAVNPLARVGVDIVAAVVVFLSLVRILDPRGQRRTVGRTGGATPRAAAQLSRPRGAQPTAGPSVAPRSSRHPDRRATTGPVPAGRSVRQGSSTMP